MDKQIITFSANEQILKKTAGQERFADDVVGYIEAHFDLGDNWTGYDSVRAVWFTAFAQISTVLDQDGVCLVPPEVCNRKETVNVNLVGSIVENDELTDRLTTYPIVAFIFDGNARVDGTETAPVTPSQFEQFVAIVKALVGSVKDIDHAVLNADYTLTIYYSDNTSDTVGPIRGEQGPIGPTGNGIASIAKTGTSGTNPVVDTYTITYTNGQTTTFTVTNGVKGDTGNGIESIYLTGQSGAVKTYTILMTDGSTFQFDVTDGEVTEAVLDEATIVQTLSDDEPYLFRQTNNGNGSGNKKRLKAIIGASVGWNQQVQNGNFESNSGWEAVGAATTRSTADNIITATNPTGAQYFGFRASAGNGVAIAGHKYFLSIQAKASVPISAYAPYYDGSKFATYAPTKTIGTSWETLERVVSCTANGDINLGIRKSSGNYGSELSLYGQNAYVCDITGLLGSAIADYVYTLEQTVTGSGIAWLRKYGILTEPYYAYDAGSIKSVEGLSAHEMIGFNQWDEEYRTDGYYNSSGQWVSIAGYFSSKNPIPVEPSTAYYFSNNQFGGVTYWDGDMNFISRNNSTQLFTTPSNCRFLHFNMVVGYGSVYNHDICINISDASLNGQYAPYEKHSYPLDSTVTLRGPFKLDNGKLKADGDVYKSSGEVIRPYAEYTFTGNEAWQWYEASTPSGSFWYCSPLSVAGKTDGLNICSNGVKVTVANNTQTRITVRDNPQISSSTNMSTLFSSGTGLVYELATPTTDSADPYQQTEVCDPSGTEQFVIDNGAFPIPVGHDTEYPMTIIDTMPKANGSYTMHLTVANGKRTISWS